MSKKIIIKCDCLLSADAKEKIAERLSEDFDKYGLIVLDDSMSYELVEVDKLGTNIEVIPLE